MKKVKNPLTIIGLFAGIAEVAGRTVVLPLVSESLQKIFIWYVMGFPVLLVVLFFITLNRNAKVLYAPSDFSNEDNFMELLTKADHVLSQTIETSPSHKLEPIEELIETVAMDADTPTTSVFSSTVETDHTNCFIVIGENKYELNRPITVIGKAEWSDIIIKNPAISRKHCQIEKIGDNRFSIVDNGTTNHTYLNDKMLQGNRKYPLNNGDILRFANVQAMFSQEEE